MPTNCDDFPEFFSEAEMVHLEGCASLLKNIADRKDEMRKSYDLLAKEVAEFKKFTFEEYSIALKLS